MVDMEGQVQLMNSSAESTEVAATDEPSVMLENIYQDRSFSPETEDNSSEPLSSAPEMSEYQDLQSEAPANEEYRDLLAEQSANESAAIVAAGTQPENFQDIQDFGNSDLPTSPLMYTLIIEGIDRGDLRKELAEIFSDERFKLNPRETLELVKDGKLELNGLNAVKASVLVMRLRRLPLQISWRQHAYQG